MNQDLASLSRYAKLIEQSIGQPPPFVPTVEDDSTVRVERGVVLVHAMAGRDGTAVLPIVRRLLDLDPARLSRLAVVDHHGHRRDAYRGLLAYCCIGALALLRDQVAGPDAARWEQCVAGWCEATQADVTSRQWAQSSIPAAQGAPVAGVCWSALALYATARLLDRDAWRRQAQAVFTALCQAQCPSGAFLAAGAADNPETHWYHELVLLHAAASYAVQSHDRAAHEAIQRNARFHLAETQPDHATAQPWGLTAFILTPDARPLADQLLHTVATQHPSSPAGVSLMLLADALYCLRMLARHSDTPPARP